MPAGVSWGQYLSFSAAAAISMLTGSQLVHQYYRPLQNLQDFINTELTNLPEHVQAKIRSELKEEGILR